MPGIDIQEGLTLVAGNRNLYLRLLRQFPETYAAADRRIRANLAEGKLDDAIREAHTVKGLAGQMGARELYRAAGRLETALRSASPVDAALQCFADSLAQVTRGLVEFSEAQREPTVAGKEITRSLVDNETVDHALP